MIKMMILVWITHTLNTTSSWAATFRSFLVFTGFSDILACHRYLLLQKGIQNSKEEKYTLSISIFNATITSKWQYKHKYKFKSTNSSLFTADCHSISLASPSLSLNIYPNYLRFFQRKKSTHVDPFPFFYSRLFKPWSLHPMCNLHYTRLDCSTLLPPHPISFHPQTSTPHTHIPHKIHQSQMILPSSTTPASPPLPSNRHPTFRLNTSHPSSL